jgi:hypothetical protein
MALDRYTYQARLLPSVIVLLPAWLVVGAWLPTDEATKAVASSAVIYVGLAALAAQFGRDLGKRKEPALFARWGGSPTTRMLRHADSTLPTPLRARYHEKLSALCGVTLPTPQAEAVEPAAADSAYETCARSLRERTRDRKKFRLVFSENINYGFRRNVWAMKPGGIAIALLGSLGCALRILADTVVEQAPSVNAIMGVLVSVILLTWWLVRITPSWVKLAAEAYGERLLGATEKLEL